MPATDLEVCWGCLLRPATRRIHVRQDGADHRMAACRECFPIQYRHAQRRGTVTRIERLHPSVGNNPHNPPW